MHLGKYTCKYKNECYLNRNTQAHKAVDVKTRNMLKGLSTWHHVTHAHHMPFIQGTGFQGSRVYAACLLMPPGPRT